MKSANVVDASRRCRGQCIERVSCSNPDQVALRQYFLLKGELHWTFETSIHLKVTMLKGHLWRSHWLEVRRRWSRRASSVRLVAAAGGQRIQRRLRRSGSSLAPGFQSRQDLPRCGARRRTRATTHDIGRRMRGRCINVNDMCCWQWRIKLLVLVRCSSRDM